MRLLIVKLSAFGDIVQSFYAIQDLSRAHPEVAIDWCVDQRFVGLLALNKNISNIVSAPLRQWRNNWWRLSTGKDLISWFLRLRRVRYDYAVDIQGAYKSGLIVNFSSSRRKIGISWKKTEGFVEFLYKEKVLWPRGLGAVNQYRSVLASIFNYDFSRLPLLSGLERHQHSSSLRKNDGSTWSLAILLTGSSVEKYWPHKLWEVFLGEITDHAFRVTLLWSDSLGHKIAQSLTARIQNVSIASSALSFSEWRDCIDEADCVVGHDSGPAHLSVAMGQQTVIVFGVTSPAGFGVIGRSNLCCVGEAGQWPRPDQVLEAVRQRTRFLQYQART